VTRDPGREDGETPARSSVHLTEGTGQTFTVHLAAAYPADLRESGCHERLFARKVGPPASERFRLRPAR
jgi:hypothetical protein